MDPLLLPYPPDDLDEFWRELIDEALAAPLDASRSAASQARMPEHRIETFRFRGIDGGPRHGWIAVPEGARRAPAFLWIPPYGRWSMRPNEQGTRPGWVSMSFNFFGESAFHDEPYRRERGYFAEGLSSPEEYIYRRMAQDSLLAFRVLRALQEVDEDRMAVMGLSQGGGMAIWLGAYAPWVRAVVSDLPFLSAMPWVLSRQIFRYPLRELVDAMDDAPLGWERGRYTLSYFDTVNLATRCQVPTRVTLGLKDPSVRPEQARAVFEALPGEKQLREYDAGHDWHPDMIPEALRWLEDHTS